MVVCETKQGELREIFFEKRNGIISGPIIRNNDLSIPGQRCLYSREELFQVGTPVPIKNNNSNAG